MAIILLSTSGLSAANTSYGPSAAQATPSQIRESATIASHAQIAAVHTSAAVVLSEPADALRTTNTRSSDAVAALTPPPPPTVPTGVGCGAGARAADERSGSAATELSKSAPINDDEPAGRTAVGLGASGGRERGAGVGGEVSGSMYVYVRGSASGGSVFRFHVRAGFA
jgi:hypothetical protein